jgi:hypothetical protein
MIGYALLLVGGVLLYITVSALCYKFVGERRMDQFIKQNRRRP